MMKHHIIILAVMVGLASPLSAQDVSRKACDTLICSAHKHHLDTPKEWSRGQEHGATKRTDLTNVRKYTPQEAAEEVAAELGLSSKQKKKLQKLNKEYASLIANPRFGGRPQMAQESPSTAGKSDEELSDHDLHIRRQYEMRNRYVDKLRTILSSDQYVRYEKTVCPFSHCNWHKMGKKD